MRAALLLVLAGCTLDFVDDPKPMPDPPPPPLTAAERAWREEALPNFQAQCVQCHGNNGVGAMAFLAGNDEWEIRRTILASGVVNLDMPTASRVLQKGSHTGPAMTAQVASDILSWIVAERDERQ
jgi:mono/diheme cytochrome c family protein